MSIIEKVKILFSIRKPVGELIDEAKKIKAGWKDPAFWATVVASILSVIAGLQSVISIQLSLIITTIITMVYNVYRAILNAGVAGITPLLRSTRFWTTVGGIVVVGLEALKAGGISEPWMATTLSVLAVIGISSQVIGAKQPTPQP